MPVNGDVIFQGKYLHMSDRVMPIPEKFASCPYDEKILEYYKGQFECVFVLLHPFIKPIELSIERFCPAEWPSKKELIEGCEAISWKRILEITGLVNISDIDIGLRTSISGLNKELVNKDYASCLKKVCDKKNIVYPSEGEFSPLIENKIFNSIKHLGHEWLWVGDEFASERKLMWIDDLLEKNEIPSHGCIFTHDHSLLVTTHWDSHCSFLCSSKETVERILEIDDFEGFYCTEKTEVYWGAYEI